MRRIPVARLPGGAPVALDAGAAHHVLHVLRHPVGGALVLFDGAGQEVDAVLVRATADGCEVSATGPVRRRAPPHALHLVFGIPKGAPLDHALRMATECGATHLHPVLTRRSVPKGDHGDRWARILESASAQCGRADVPDLSPLVPLRDAIASLPAGLDRRVALPGADRSGPASGPACLVVGPEGGLAPDEVRSLLDDGFAPMGLGAWVLRVDTAIAVGVAALAPA